MNSGMARKAIIYVLIAIAVIAIFFTVFPVGAGPAEKPISAVVEMARAEQLAKIEVLNNNVEKLLQRVLNTKLDTFLLKKILVLHLQVN